jgi:hypothetical protein
MSEPTVAERLAEPFDPKEVKWKAQTVKNNRALAVAYIDARLVMDRLDEVLGLENWQDKYEVMGDGSVVCTLQAFIGEHWVSKADVGSLSEQPDAGDRLKAAFSDALKRAAVKYGIGRYLYSLPSQWCDYDPVKKQLTQLPQLPDWAQPTREPAAPKLIPPPIAKTADGVKPLVSNILAQLRGAKSVEDGIPVWKQFEKAAADLTDDEKAQVKKAFADLKAKFPATAKA